MAREFSTSEIIRQKCSICGIKNKKYTELIYKNKNCGYKLTCCNCGHVDTFIEDENHIASHSYSKGREVCIQHTTCNNKQCPYYGKYNLIVATHMIDDIVNNVESDSEEDSTTTDNDEIKILINTQLDINGYDLYNPKFH